MEKHEFEWKSTVTPVFDADTGEMGVRIDEWEVFRGKILQKRRKFMNLQEKAIRKALKLMGWTPPPWEKDDEN